MIYETGLHEIVVDPSEEVGGQGAVEEQLDHIDHQADLDGRVLVLRNIDFYVGRFNFREHSRPQLLVVFGLPDFGIHSADAVITHNTVLERNSRKNLLMQ